MVRATGREGVELELVVLAEGIGGSGTTRSPELVKTAASRLDQAL